MTPFVGSVNYDDQYLIVFAVRNGRSVAIELAHPHPISHNALNYSPAEIGAAIREAAPPNSAVMLAESDDSLPLWFYVSVTGVNHWMNWCGRWPERPI